MNTYNYTRFTARGPLIAVAAWMRIHHIWDRFPELVPIVQKTIRYTPHQKMLGVLMTILAGGKGLVEANILVRPDMAVRRAFQFKDFPEQSTLSEALNACNEESVAGMRQFLAELYRRHGQAMPKKGQKRWLVLDVDLTGLTCGKKAEGATKGYFSGKRGQRGRQVGRVVVAHTGEIIAEKLYQGKQQLSQVFMELVQQAEEVLRLTNNPEQRRHTLLRVDAGAGTEVDINGALERGYMVLTKLKHHKRSQNLIASVQEWVPDPKVSGRWVGWVEEPHAFARPTLQIAIRSAHKRGRTAKRGKAAKRDATGQVTERVLLMGCSPRETMLLAHESVEEAEDRAKVALAIAHLYDARGGGVETENRQDKQGLGLSKRNKKSFLAQEMLMLLVELAHNLLLWIREGWIQINPCWRKWGIQRLVHEVFQVNGKLEWNRHHPPPTLTLAASCQEGRRLLRALRAMVGGKLIINLGEI